MVEKSWKLSSVRAERKTTTRYFQIFDIFLDNDDIPYISWTRTSFRQSELSLREYLKIGCNKKVVGHLKNILFSNASLISPTNYNIFFCWIQNWNDSKFPARFFARWCDGHSFFTLFAHIAKQVRRSWHVQLLQNRSDNRTVLDIELQDLDRCEEINLCFYVGSRLLCATLMQFPTKGFIIRENALPGEALAALRVREREKSLWRASFHIKKKKECIRKRKLSLLLPNAFWTTTGAISFPFR